MYLIRACLGTWRCLWVFFLQKSSLELYNDLKCKAWFQLTYFDRLHTQFSLIFLLVLVWISSGIFVQTMIFDIIFTIKLKLSSFTKMKFMTILHLADVFFFLQNLKNRWHWMRSQLSDDFCVNVESKQLVVKDAHVYSFGRLFSSAILLLLLLLQNRLIT